MKRTNTPFSEIDIKGGVISKDDGDIIHTFATPGTYIFAIDTIGSDYVGQGLKFDTLIVGDGGGGGGANAGNQVLLLALHQFPWLSLVVAVVEVSL